jgi:two-component system cell cycle response regulator
VAQVAERLRQTVDRLRIAIDDAEIAVTVSVGVAVCECRVREDPEALLARVDTALYKAKALGRNRLAFAHSGVLD